MSTDARHRMVEDQLRGRGIADARVLAAMRAVPRERFVPDQLAHQAYADGALPIDAGQSISQPWIVARMTELLAPQRGDRVLELGTGTGYQAAILASMGARVLTVERHKALAEQARARLRALALDHLVEVRVGDGSQGVGPEDGPFDGIIVTAAAPSIPDQLREQLRDGGRLVIPVGTRDRQVLTRAVRHGNDWIETSHGACMFVPLVGPGGFPE